MSFINSVSSFFSRHIHSFVSFIFFKVTLGSQGWSHKGNSSSIRKHVFYKTVQIGAYSAKAIVQLDPQCLVDHKRAKTYVLRLEFSGPDISPYAITQTNVDPLVPSSMDDALEAALQRVMHFMDEPMLNRRRVL